MKPAIDILEKRISAAMADVTGLKDAPAIVRPTTDPKFGDYQANGVMALAKQLKTNPRKLAEEVVNKLNTDPRSPTPDPRLIDICEKPEVAGAGFINLRLKPDFIAERFLQIWKDPVSLGIEKTCQPKTIVVDFSSPNIAKEMHVGHLRSTIIGDCICRLLEFLGHDVKRQNHIGDWGTQFGMLVALRRRELVWKAADTMTGTQTIDFSLEDIERFYREAKHLYDTDPDFAEDSRSCVVDLQHEEPLVMNYWRQIVNSSLAHCEELYQILNVALTRKDVCGESFYNKMLPHIVDELQKKGLGENSENAVCVFPPGFKTKEGKPLPFMIQKSDGAYLYATTDLAALRYRVNELKADKIIYVTDARQKLHFEMLFATARMAGWVPEKVELVHVTFGSVLGDDGTPLKTREGENVKLKELLAQAVDRARKIVNQKNPDLPAEQKEKIAKAVGIGAVKYADFSNNRTSDYVFSFDKMLAMDGNTAPYMQYAYARIKSIERKAQERNINVEDELTNLQSPRLTDPDEIDLAKHLIRYGEAIQAAAADYRPNYLTAYLYDLAQKFSSFYTNCPVLDAGPDRRPTRLLLCRLTARTIEHGLSNLLGIEVIERM
jgi:arginyl-tRNA synthetase